VEKHVYELVAIVIVVIPITIGVPTVAVFIPPTVPPAPAVFARFTQVVPRMIRLPAVPAVMLNGFVQLVVRPGDSPLAISVVFCRSPRRSSESQHAEKRRNSEHRPSEKPFLSQMKRHVSSILPKYPRLGWGGVLFHRTQLGIECSKRRTTL
jgi:hypothetical protein